MFSPVVANVSGRLGSRGRRQRRGLGDCGAIRRVLGKKRLKIRIAQGVQHPEQSRHGGKIIKISP